jgi:hypothetical protein
MSEDIEEEEVSRIVSVGDTRDCYKSIEYKL